MATPIGHGIVGYLIARGAGVKSPVGFALAAAAAALPDIDMLHGYVANGDMFSLHHETITHRPAFALIVGGATGLAALALGRNGGRAAFRPAALATVLVGSHIAMDPLPLPYDTLSLRSASFWQAIVTHFWNSVIDLTVYGALAMLVLRRGRAADEAAEA